MVFTSFTSLWFLAGVFAVYWLLRERRPKSLFLVIASYVPVLEAALEPGLPPAAQTAIR
ncbi:MAG TPA: hypothetical protein VHR17_05160 [Thermoanaerobaculia bacterium]|nr:hypothetical protein [Thermoanaerobaculia bacterium]